MHSFCFPFSARAQGGTFENRNLIVEAHGRREVLVRREGRRCKDAQEVRELECRVGVRVHRCVPV